MGWRDERKNAAAKERPRRFQRRDDSDPRGLVALAKGYLQWMAVKNYSPSTCYQRELYLDRLITWCELRSITRASEVTRPVLERYQRALYLHRKPDGLPMSFASQHERLIAVRGFCKWLVRQGHILYNPASELELPRLPSRLPKAVLTEAEAERVMTTPNTNELQGLRDRAILETAYSTGMRRMELAHLRCQDLDQERATVFVRQGKGKKDRVLPVGERALHWIGRYLVEVRPKLAVEPDEGWLFLTSHGDAFTPQGMTSRVRDCVRASGVKKPGGCHLFRHTMATVMLENGADIRFIQQMLGHANLSTTEIYTRVSVRKLQEVHRHTHPTAKLETESTSPASPASDDAVAKIAENDGEAE